MPDAPPDAPAATDEATGTAGDRVATEPPSDGHTAAPHDSHARPPRDSHATEPDGGHAEPLDGSEAVDTRGVPTSHIASAGQARTTVSIPVDTDDTDDDGDDAEEVPGNDDARPEDLADRRTTAKDWWSSLVAGFWLWVTAVVMYVLVTTVSWLPFDGLRQAPRTFSEVMDNWHRWDTTWYVIIADAGYKYDPRAAAFFPLYPLLIKAVKPIVPGDTLIAALVVSLLTCLAALVMVHRLAADIMGPVLGRRTAFYLLIFPTGFYLAAAYNESLFVALATGSLYAMRRQRWWLAGLLAGLASATRLAGILLILAFLYEYARQAGWSVRRIRPGLAGVLLAPLGLAAYAWYCAKTFGDPLFFQKQQSVWFRAGYSPPWVTIDHVVRMIIDSQPLLGPTTMRNVINLVTALGVVGLLLVALDDVWGLGRRYAYLVVFAAADILLPLVSPINSDYPLSSLWRFALECTPVFMVLAKIGRRRNFDRFYTMIALSIQGVMLLTFIQNQFVA
jgi:hypothetical protein